MSTMREESGETRPAIVRKHFYRGGRAKRDNDTARVQERRNVFPFPLS